MRRLGRGERGAKIHPYDAPETIAGAGTVALEWEEDLARLALPGLDTVLVAVGGGGLIAGVAAWFAGRVKVVGVEPEFSRAMDAAFAAGRPVDVSVNSIAANSLGAKRVGDLNFAIARKFVAEVALVPDAAIVEAQRRLWRDVSIVAEPGGAAAFAALDERRLSAGKERARRRPRLRRERRSRGAARRFCETGGSPPPSWGRPGGGSRHADLDCFRSARLPSMAEARGETLIRPRDPPPRPAPTRGAGAQRRRRQLPQRQHAQAPP